MKVLLVNISLDAKLGGGTAERTRHLAIHLAKAGCACEVVAMTGNSWWQEFDEHGIPAYITVNLGKRFPIPLVNPWRAWRSIRSSDVLHIMGYWNLLSVFYAALAVLARRPYILCPAGEFAALPPVRPVSKVFHALFGRRLIKYASGFIAITELETGVIAETANIPVQSIPVVPNAVAEPAIAPGAASVALPDEPYILFMGRLAPIKGPDFLIQAYIDTPSVHSVPLVMAGPDFGMQQDLQTMVDASPVAKNVRFAGFLNEQSRVEAYRRAMILVIPSRSEAMSLVALEAGVLGVPVLLTNTCGFDEIESIGGGVVVEPSAEGISAGLQRMLEDRQELQLKGQRLKDYVLEHYSWSSTVKGLIGHFESLLRARGSAPK